MTPTSKVRMGPTSWPRRHVSRSIVWSVNIVTTVTICTNGNKLPFGSLSMVSVTAAIRSSWMPQPSSWICRDRLHRPRPVSMNNRIGQSTSLQRRLRRKLQLLDTWIIMLTVLYSYGQFEVTFDDKYVCLQTFGLHRI